MTYKKETCKYGKCEKCKFYGYMMIADRPAPNKLINNKPHGTSANDRRF